MTKKHLFEYSNDNKRYHTYTYYLKQTYQQKVFRIPLDVGFTCPNRDGHCGYGGCSFCSVDGSGDAFFAAKKNLQRLSPATFFDCYS